MSKMFLAAAVLLLALAAPVSAQPVTGLGFAVIGPGSVSDGGDTTLHFSGGGEVLHRGVGALAEVGFLGPTAGMSDGLGVLSLNGVYHIRVRRESGRVVSPFVTGGYSMFFRDGYANLWNLGGGIDWWLGRRVGVRFEVRDHVWSESYSSPYYSYSHTSHFWNVRTGVVFR